MNLQSSDFELFELPERFAQDRAVIDARWKSLQRQAHPDRFTSQGEAAQRVAMQWSVRINEAYQRLKDPVRRAGYLCGRHGAPVNAETHTAMPPDFLVQQMSWREALDDATGLAELDRLEREVLAARSENLAQLARCIDQDADYPAAAARVRALMFIERFASDLDARRETLGQ